MLTAHDIHLGVPGRTLIRDLSFALPRGSCTALLGRNGVGKTTLLHALAGLRPCQRGAVHYDGQPIGQLRRRDAGRRIGVLLQAEHESFWGTVAEYVALGRLPHQAGWPSTDDADTAAVRQALQQLDLVRHADQTYRTLSGGERQRARIAQVLAQDPQVLLLDEPLTHLDLGHQALAMAHFRTLARSGRTVLMSLHEPLWAARYCDAALLLYDSGRFCYGPTREILTLEHLEPLYGCRLEPVALHDRRLFVPSA
jgi:iron complex transport system ATP-binding protein